MGCHRGFTDKRKRYHKSTDENRNKLINDLYTLPPKDNILLLASEKEIQENLKFKSIRLLSGIHTDQQIRFLKSYPINRYFLLCDGKEIIAWAKFLMPSKESKNHATRKIIYGEFKPGVFIQKIQTHTSDKLLMNTVKAGIKSDELLHAFSHRKDIRPYHISIKRMVKVNEKSKNN